MRFPGGGAPEFPSGRRGSERGAVTAELALALPSVMLLLGALLAVASVVLDQMRCVDAARAGARAAARHDPEDVVRSTARTAGPPGSRVTVSAEGDQIVVTVRAEVRLFLPGRPRIGVGAQAVADAEATARQPPDRHPVRPPAGPEGA